MPASTTIAAMDLITPLGMGLGQTWPRILAGDSGLAPAGKYLAGSKQAPWAAEIPESIMGRVPADDSEPPGGKSFVLSREVGRRVLGQVRALAEQTDRQRLGLILSSTKGDMADFARAAAGKQSRGHYNISTLARDLAKVLDIAGPVMAVSNACASGVAALAQGARIINTGGADLMLVLGVDALSGFIMEGFAALRALGAGACRPFDESRDGLCLGEGAAGVLLARSDLAGEPGLARVMGWGISNDAAHITAPSRSGSGLQLAVRSALAMAGLKPGDVDFINAHGTGTVYNDEMEARAFYEIFYPGGPPVYSLKGCLGHTLGAAGVLEAILTVMSLSEGVVPASKGCVNFGAGKPISVPTANLEMERCQYALTAKSGFGGINAVMILGRGAADE